MASTVAQVEAAAASFATTGQGRVPVGDISFEHGGDIAGHASHETGLDVDLWPIRTDSAQCTASRITWKSSTYDRAATRTLVRAIRDRAPNQVALIYFNDPTLISEGLTTQYPNHDNHLCTSATGERPKSKPCHTARCSAGGCCSDVGAVPRRDCPSGGRTPSLRTTDTSGRTTTDMSGRTRIPLRGYAVEDRIEDLIAPFAEAAARLDEIPCVGPVAAWVIIAEVGVDMTRFPTAPISRPGPSSARA